jgi:tetratricopeptide (TPR) repeat protein
MDLASQQHSARLSFLSIAGAWVALFLMAVLAYWPGLGGPFVLDDQGTLGALGSLGGVKDWASFKAFVFAGTAGPTGRPLALLSFLIDGNTWPTDPAPFKRTNLAIHLITGGMLGLLISKLLLILKFNNRDVRWIALVSTACWILHPFLVSTTLYVVQRMAQLSTLFVIAGLIGHLYGRSLLTQNSRRAYVVMSVSVVLFTLLAMLSKENGILLPLLIGVIELTVVASQREHVAALDRRWVALFLAAPSLVIVAYLGVRGFRHDFFDIVPPRDFSIYERVLTQPRILVDYLQSWFVPNLYTTGVFQDHFIKSTGVFSPITTILSLLFHIAVITVSIVYRRKLPLFALAVLFFYASHLLESTVLNLELYFEHRNYLAAAFLFLPVVALLHARVSRNVGIIATFGVLLILAGFTRYSATVWQDFPGMVEASARKAPTSARAQAQYATILFNSQRYDESLQVLDRAIENIPGNNPLLLINRVIVLCNLGILDSGEFERVAGVLSDIVYDVRSIKLYTTFTASVAAKRCPDVSIGSLRPMFEDMLRVKHNADPHSLAYSHIKYFVGLVNVHLEEPDNALISFTESLQAEAGAEHAMSMAAFMATNEYYEEALLLSDQALLHLGTGQEGAIAGPPVSESSIREFQATVRAEIEAARTN